MSAAGAATFPAHDTELHEYRVGFFFFRSGFFGFVAVTVQPVPYYVSHYGGIVERVFTKDSMYVHALTLRSLVDLPVISLVRPLTHNCTC